MKFFHRQLLFALGLLFAAGANAQPVSVRESETVISGPQHEILSCPGGDYLVITYHYMDDKDAPTVARFDPKSMSPKYTNTVQELAQQHYRAAMYSGDRLFALFSNKEGGVSRYEINDKTGALSGSPTPLFDVDAKEEDVSWFSGSSGNKDFHYLAVKGHLRKEKGEVLQGVVLDKQMNKITLFSYITPEDRDDFQGVDFVQADNGALSLIYGIGVKPKKDDYRPNQYTLVQIDAKGKTAATPLSSLPDGDLRDLSWKAQGSQLLFTGLLSTEKKAGFTVFVSGSYDPMQKKVSDLRSTEIKTLLKQDPDIIKEIEKKGLPDDVAVLRTIPLSDGSKAMILESNSDRFYQSHYAPAMQNPSPAFNRPGMTPGAGMMTASYSIVYHKRGDAFVLMLDKTNTPKWLNVISKKQEEGDIVISIGISCIADSKDNIQMFFYDNKKNTDPATRSPRGVTGTDKGNSFACVTIARDGKMTKEFIEDKDRDFRYMLEKSMTEKNNQIVLMDIRTKKAFTVEHLFNHAGFKLTTIEAK